MGKTSDEYGDATRRKIKRLRGLAIRDLGKAGYEDPSEQAIQSRLSTLLAQEGLQLSTPRKRQRKLPGLISTFSRGLALIQTFCQSQGHKLDQRRSQKRRGTAEPERPNEIPYYFAAIPDDYVDHFARYLPPSAALVLLILWRYAKLQMQTWISHKTICEKAGLSRNTVRRDLRLLAECKIVIRADAGGKDFNGKAIKKDQGDKFWLNWPLAWDKEGVKTLEWRNSHEQETVDK